MWCRNLSTAAWSWPTPSCRVQTPLTHSSLQLPRSHSPIMWVMMGQLKEGNVCKKGGSRV